jgi:hypothetical protein
MESDAPNLDELVVIGLEPQTWYRFVQLQIDLLRRHVEGLEKQIDESIKAYEKEKVATEVEHVDGGYPFVILEEHQGVEGPPNHLEEIFKYYFPNLHRRSTLIILFSFLEHQIDQLCELYAHTQKLNILHTDLKDKGIDRSRRYLKKVILLLLDDNSIVWQEIKRIQKVRNAIVHNDGKLVDNDTIKYVNTAHYLARANESYYNFEIDEINILDGYLTHVLQTIDSYCSELNNAIETSLALTPPHAT